MTHPKRKQLIILSIVATVVVAIAVVITLVNNPVKDFIRDVTTNDTRASTTASGVENVDLEDTAAVTKAATALYNEGSDIQAATTLYDKAIKVTKDEAAAAVLSLEKAMLLVRDQKLNEALAIVLVVEKETPSDISAAALGLIYAQQGDKTAAKQYYATAIERIPVGAPINIKAGYEAQLAIL